jgi:hypothetical protein
VVSVTDLSGRILGFLSSKNTQVLYPGCLLEIMNLIFCSLKSEMLEFSKYGQ